MAYLTGRGLPRGGAPARVWLARACDGGDGGGCILLGALEADAAKAQALRQRACQLGFQEACGS
jgi:TPR repeat protein